MNGWDTGFVGQWRYSDTTMVDPHHAVFVKTEWTLAVSDVSMLGHHLY